MSLYVIGEGRAMTVLMNAEANYGLGLTEASHQVGAMLVRRTQNGMTSGPHSGRVYGRHRASAPGEYPAVRKGKLLRSIDYDARGFRALHFGSHGAVNGGFDYAVGTHEGTSKMAARPYLTMTVDETASATTRVLGDTVWRKIIGG